MDKKTSKKTKAKNEVKAKAKKKAAAFKLQVSLEDTLQAGCHFGHTVAKTHPRIKPYLYTSRDGVQIFDLVKTRKQLEEATKFLYQLAREGKQTLFVGTKRQAKKIIRQTAQASGSVWVTERWLGGTLTNWEQISRRLDVLRKLSKDWEKGVYGKRTKKEQAIIRRKLAYLRRFFGGLVDLKQLPAALFIADIKRDAVAVREAQIMKIPVVAIVDSNADPSLTAYPIPANDDAIKSIKLLAEEIGRAVALGRGIKLKKSKKEATDGKAKKSKG